MPGDEACDRSVTTCTSLERAAAIFLAPSLVDAMGT